MLGPRVARQLEQLWYCEPDWRHWLLAPLAGLFALLSFIRRAGYRVGVLRVTRLPVPVIVVGNLSVGGSGKSPLVAALAKWLLEAGWHPGIVSRGYGGSAGAEPVVVTPDSTVEQVGDEAVMQRRASSVPVAIGHRRVDAARLLIDRAGCDILLSDDGLQHYAMGRDIEIVVADGERRFGNGWLLPAGPLRESVRRLTDADTVWFKHTEARACEASASRSEAGFLLGTERLRALGGGVAKPLDALSGTQVAALTAIAHPDSFFAALVAAGCRVRACALPDHASIRAQDLEFAGDLPLLLTEKDAVKVDPAWREDVWVVETRIDLNDHAGLAWRNIVERLARLRSSPSLR